MYELQELARYIDHARIKEAKANRNATAIGRNCTLFETLRVFAYKEIRKHSKGSYEAFYDVVEAKGKSINEDFESPLFDVEVRATVKSIAKYCWKNMDNLCKNKWQVKGGLNSAKTRKERSEQRKQQILELKNQGKKQREIAEILEVSDRTIRTVLNQKAEMNS